MTMKPVESPLVGQLYEVQSEWPCPDRIDIPFGDSEFACYSVETTTGKAHFVDEMPAEKESAVTLKPVECRDPQSLINRAIKYPAKVTLDDGRELELILWEPRVGCEGADTMISVTIKAVILVPQEQ
jgi:hypothetical protein